MRSGLVHRLKIKTNSQKRNLNAREKTKKKKIEYIWETGRSAEMWPVWVRMKLNYSQRIVIKHVYVNISCKFQSKNHKQKSNITKDEKKKQKKYKIKQLQQRRIKWHRKYVWFVFLQMFVIGWKCVLRGMACFALSCMSMCTKWNHMNQM